MGDNRTMPTHVFVSGNPYDTPARSRDHGTAPGRAAGAPKALPPAPETRGRPESVARVCAGRHEQP